jgi:hypothetical protein
VGAHESGTGGDGIYYRVGHFANPADGDFTVQWDSGQWGIRYDAGINPHIVINNCNEIVSVHQVPGEDLLHYRRGTLSGGTIQFTESKRYDDNGAQPPVLLSDTGSIMEVHTMEIAGQDGRTGVYARSGRLNRIDPSTILWDPVIPIFQQAWGYSEYPQLVGNGPDVLFVFTNSTVAYALMHYSAGAFCDW